MLKVTLIKTSFFLKNSDFLTMLRSYMDRDLKYIFICNGDRICQQICSKLLCLKKMVQSDVWSIYLLLPIWKIYIHKGHCNNENNIQYLQTCIQQIFFPIKTSPTVQLIVWFLLIQITWQFQSGLIEYF